MSQTYGNFQHISAQMHAVNPARTQYVTKRLPGCGMALNTLVHSVSHHEGVIDNQIHNFVFQLRTTQPGCKAQTNENNACVLC